MRTYNVHVDFISEEGAVLYSRTYPIIAESALMAETWVANILAVTDISARKRYTADLARVVLKVTDMI